MTNLETQVLQELRQLPPDKQNQVLNFVQFLKQEQKPKSLKSVRGLCADLNFDLTEEDIAEARAEMWSNLGEEIPNS